MAILIVLGVVAMGLTTSWKFNIVDILNIVFMIMGEVAVFGYAFRRKVWTKLFWETFFVVTLAYQLIYSFYLDQHYGAAPATTIAGGLVTFLPLIPMYLATVLYVRSRLAD